MIIEGGGITSPLFFEMLPSTIFFFIAFSLILATKHLMLSEYGIPWTGFGKSVIGALLVGKVVLIVDKLPFVNRFPEKPLIYNTILKKDIDTNERFYV